MEELQAAVTKQQSLIKELKSNNVGKEEIEKAVAELQRLRIDLEKKVKEQNKEAGVSNIFDRAGIESLLKRRFFICPAFEIYGGVAGLYDFGPPGCAVKANLLALWRQHFVMEENMLEVDTTTLTPEIVLKTSGHVDKFNDMMVKDVVTGDCYRADKLLEERIDKLMEDPMLPTDKREYFIRVRAQADAFSEKELAAKLKEFEVKAPDTGNDLSEPFPFNLMFKTSIGPTGNLPGYMRPETAQGIFVNFKRLLDFNGNRMPFAGAQIGLAFRNEIAPRSGLIRVREFTLAEIEHFVNPNDKRHPKFSQVADLEIQLFPRQAQVETGKFPPMKLGYAVAQGIIANETLAYFMGRTFLFLVRGGARPEFVRFRQHLKTEMAHYATDCWDAELRMSYGWVECVGHADRACYDLKVHSEKSKIDMVAREDFAEPRFVEELRCIANKSLLGSTFRKDGPKVLAYLESLDEGHALGLQEKLDSAGSAMIEVDRQPFKITKEMIKMEKVLTKQTGQSFIPSVIEPSFGIGRIIYGILEHAFYTRDASQDRESGTVSRDVLRLPAVIAPIKCSVLPLSSNEIFVPFTQRLHSGLVRLGVAAKLDESSVAIGRRYARTDEIGIPFGCTVDFDSVTDETCTLRERDSMQQIRAKINEMPSIIKRLVEGELSWEQVRATYPKFES